MHVRTYALGGVLQENLLIPRSWGETRYPLRARDLSRFNVGRYYFACIEMSRYS